VNRFRVIWDDIKDTVRILQECFHREVMYNQTNSSIECSFHQDFRELKFA